MKYFTTLILFLLVATVHSSEMPIVKMQTNLGTIVLELNSSLAPQTVDNFIRYIQAGFYNDLIFHRVVKGFMIQGGAYTQDYKKKAPIYEPIASESDNGLENRRGTITMSRNTYDPDSATSQFFINISDNQSLDSFNSLDGAGYTVFGHVTFGMEVVDKIQEVKTGTRDSLKNVPESPIIIEKITVKNIPTKPKVPVDETDTSSVVETVTPQVSTTISADETEPDTSSVVETVTETPPIETHTKAETVKEIPRQIKPQEEKGFQIPTDSSLEIPPDPPTEPDKPEPLPD